MRKRIIEFDYLDKNKVQSHVIANYETGEVFVEDFSNNPLLTFFGRRVPSIENMEVLWEMRCFPRTRYNAKEILELMGLQFYDPYSIIRINHGVLVEDFSWIRFSDEKYLTWNDVKLKNMRVK